MNKIDREILAEAKHRIRRMKRDLNSLITKVALVEMSEDHKLIRKGFDFEIQTKNLFSKEKEQIIEFINQEEHYESTGE